jgi:hypothetical protein
MTARGLFLFPFPFFLLSSLSLSLSPSCRWNSGCGEGAIEFFFSPPLDLRGCLSGTSECAVCCAGPVVLSPAERFLFAVSQSLFLSLLVPLLACF